VQTSGVAGDGEEAGGSGLSGVASACVASSITAIAEIETSRTKVRTGTCEPISPVRALDHPSAPPRGEAIER